MRVFPEEIAAARIVAQVTGASIEPHPSGRHDADLTLPGGGTIGLEVTQAMGQEVVHGWAVIAETQAEEPAPELNRLWSVSLAAGAKVKAAHPVVREQLGVLESLGETQLNWLEYPWAESSPDPAVRAAAEALKAAGVAHAFSVPPKVNGGYSFVLHEPGGWVDGRDVTDAVEAEVFKKDNLDKLTAMTTDQAHLFVWIDYSSSAPYSVLTSGVLPVPVPNMPPSLDVLWVAPRVSNEKGDWCPGRVWRLLRNRPNWVIANLN
jgi:hypothetical protein